MGFCETMCQGQLPSRKACAVATICKIGARSLSCNQNAAHSSAQVFLITGSFLESGYRKVPKGSTVKSFNYRVVLLRGDNIFKGGA